MLPRKRYYSLGRRKGRASNAPEPPDTYLRRARAIGYIRDVHGPDPTVAFVPPAMRPAASSAHKGQLALTIRKVVLLTILDFMLVRHV